MSRKSKYPGSGIYQIRCLKNFKVYVGSAVNLGQRKSTHWTELKKGFHRNSRLQNSWNKHGESEFVFEVLEFVEDKEELIDREQKWLDQLFATDRRHCFNLCPVAGSLLGTRRSDECKAMMSAKRKGAKRTPEAAESHLRAIEERRNRLGGRWRTPEHDAALEAARTRPGAEEKRLAALRAALVGGKHSPETRAKISAARKGQKPHPNTIKAVAEANRRRGGFQHTPESRARAWATRRRNAALAKQAESDESA